MRKRKLDLPDDHVEPYPGRTIDIIICIVATVVALWACCKAWGG